MGCIDSHNHIPHINWLFFNCGILIANKKIKKENASVNKFLYSPSLHRHYHRLTLYVRSSWSTGLQKTVHVHDSNRSGCSYLISIFLVLYTGNIDNEHISNVEIFIVSQPSRKKHATREPYDHNIRLYVSNSIRISPINCLKLCRTTHLKTTTWQISQISHFSELWGSLRLTFKKTKIGEDLRQLLTDEWKFGFIFKV